MHMDLTTLKWLKSQIYTVKRFLPLARRRLNTCLPAFVAILTRKPCVFFLLVFDLLVNVFFISKTPKRNRVMRKSQVGWFVKVKLTQINDLRHDHQALNLRERQRIERKINHV